LSYRQIQPALAGELVRLKPDVALTSNLYAVRGIQRVTTTIPIFNPSIVYPEAFGLVASLVRPGGQVTGLLWE
jgi:putative ABC transport system substrate-binding protein